MKKYKNFIYLHILLLIYSFTGVFSKLASSEHFLSIKFLLLYGLVIIVLIIYALFWQQILKKMTLTTAYANKSITMVWSMLWGCIFYQEKINLNMAIGALLVFIGIYFVVTDHE